MIELKNVTYAYEGDNNLKNISLSINDGECLLITGRSGCGKTTLSRVINGLIPHFYEGTLEGDVIIDEINTKDHTIGDIAAHVGSVFQDPRSQFFTTNTVSEVAFGCENKGYPYGVIADRVHRAFNQLEIGHLYDKDIFTLSSGEKQLIAIASVYAMGSKTIVFDEPSANLDHDHLEIFKSMLTTMKKEGYTLIIIEHRFHYLVDLLDRMILLENGSIKSEHLSKAITSSLIDSLGLRTLNPNIDIPDITKEQDLFSLKQVSFSYGNKKILDRYHLTGHKDEIIAITGGNGTGKTTLAKLICGLLQPSKGTIHLNGKRKIDRLKSSYFVMQDADYQLFTNSVYNELTLGNKHPDEEKIHQLLDALDLMEYIDQHPATLSGGQKQRLTIAVGILKQADVIIFDEPTSGLDGKSMRLVSQLIKKHAKDKVILIISHDDEFINLTCNRRIHLGSKNDELRKIKTS